MTGGNVTMAYPVAAESPGFLTALVVPSLYACLTARKFIRVSIYCNSAECKHSAPELKVPRTLTTLHAAEPKAVTK